MAKLTDKEVANDRVEQIMNVVALHASIYRENPSLFCEEYLNLKLKKFQTVLLTEMSQNSHF